MPKIFSPYIPSFALGPPPDSPPKDFSNLPNGAQAWASVKKTKFDIKKYFFIALLADPTLKGTLTGYYDSEPFDVGDQCKNIITKTVNSVFTPKKAERPKIGTKERTPTILDTMCAGGFNFNANITSKYRRTNALGPSPQGGESITTRRCNSEDPDELTKFYSYTITFPNSASASQNIGFLDPETMSVYVWVGFGGGIITVVPKGFAKNCKKANGTLSFFGITYDSVVPDGNALCSAKVGQANITLSWSSSNKIPLLPSS
jgi:hypothetical protein